MCIVELGVDDKDAYPLAVGVRSWVLTRRAPIRTYDSVSRSWAQRRTQKEHATSESLLSTHT